MTPAMRASFHNQTPTGINYVRHCERCHKLCHVDEPHYCLAIKREDMRPGAVFPYRGTVVTILRDREDREDIFGRTMDAWWSKREDTGAEGFLILGPDAPGLSA